MLRTSYVKNRDHFAERRESRDHFVEGIENRDRFAERIGGRETIGLNHHFSFTLLTSLFSLLLLLPTSLYSQENTDMESDTMTTVLTFSLSEAQAYAVEHNQNAQNARLNVDAAKGQVVEVRAIGLPQINGSLGYQRNLKLPASIVPAQFFDPSAPEGEVAKLTFGTKNNLNLGLEASQLLFDGSYLLGLKAVSLFVERARKEAEQQEIDVKKTVADAYIANLVAQENIGVLQKNIKVLDRVLFETTQLYENGFAELLDVDRLKLSLANLKTQERNAQQLVTVAEQLLKFQMGLDLEQAVKLTDSLTTFVQNAEQLLDIPLLDLQTQAVANRIELQLTNIQNRFRVLDIKQIRAQYMPSVAAYINGQAAFQADNFRLGKRDNWIPSAAIGINVRVPIFDGLQKRGQVQQRKVAQQQAFKQESLIKQSILLEVKQTQTNYVNAYLDLNSQKDNLKLAERIYETTRIKYKEGLGSSLEVTNAETQLYETQSLYLQALSQLVGAKTALDKALGNY